MKTIFLYIFLAQSLFAFSQKDSIQDKIHQLEKKINTSKNVDKLYLLDSLCKLTEGSSKYDSIVKHTIDHAFVLDSVRLGLKYTESYLYYLSNRSFKHDKAIEYYEDFLKRNIDTLRLDIPSLKEYARLQLLVGDAYYYSANLEKSIDYYIKTERFALKAKDSALYTKAKSYKATSYTEMGQYVLASKSYKEASEIARINKDTTRLSVVQGGLADLYSRMGFFEEAKVIRDENIKRNMYKHTYNIDATHKILISALHNASIDAEKQGKDSLRIQLLEEALGHMNEPEHQFDNPYIIYGFLRAYSETGNIKLAKQYFNQIQSKYAKQDPIPYAIPYYESTTIYYIAIKDFENALIEAKKALKLIEAANSVQGIFAIKEKLAKIYKELGEIETAYAYFESAIVIKDSVNSIQKAKALSYYQTLYETEKRDFKIADQASEIFLLDAENKIKTQWMLFGGIGLLALFTILYLVRSRKYVRTKQVLQEQYSQDLINEQEKERLRISRELHDGVGQKLMLLSKTTKKLGSSEAENLASSTLEEVRDISKGLHPSNLKRLGLTEAINALIYDINANTNLFFTDEIEEIDDLLPQDSELHLYRIIQESLSNIVKHSQAKAVKIIIRKTNQAIELFINDNGKGFNFESKQKNIGLGMKTLFERAKILNTKLNLESNIEKGTIITLNIPI